MRLRIFAPTSVVVDEPVTKVAVQAVGGAFTMLPRHVDIVAVLEPGLLSFETGSDADGEMFVAVDGGTVVKAGDDVFVSTPEAARSPDLEMLRSTVEERFLARTGHEESARLALTRLEADVIQRMVELEEHERR